MPRAFLITNKRYDCTSSTVDQQQQHQCQQINVHSRESSPERSVCTAEVSTAKDFYAISTQSESIASYKPSSPGSPAQLYNRISVLAHTGPIAKNKALINVISKASISESKTSKAFNNIDITEYSAHKESEIEVDLDDHEDQAQDLSLPHLKARLNSKEKVEENSSTYNDVSSETYNQTQSEYLSLSNDIHICPDCGKRYSTSSNLARHRQTHRSVTDKKARKCPHCDKVYVSMPAYSMHVRTHSQGCQCPFCGKCFSRPWLLQGHIRTHTGEKPFKCPICAKAFADKSNLRAHVQTHSTTKPYVCQRCGKAFALKSYLYKHEESSCMRLHRHSGHGQQRSVLSLFDDTSRSIII